MSSILRTQARRTAWIGALLLVVLNLGAGGTAFADPGNGQGDGQDNGNGVISSAGDNGSANANGGYSENAQADAAPAAVSGSSTQQPTGQSASAGTTNGSSSTSQGATKSSASQGKGATKSSTSSSSNADHLKGTAGTSGTWNLPQPPSNADQNTGGANGQCPSPGAYCSTRNGSPSLNGNGDGKAVGKPCAGCVGKADNKNPQGQRPNGSDHNAGYECDRNNGIGKTNPAHTGCKTTPTVVQTCPDGSPLPPSGVCPTPPPPPPPPSQLTCPDGSPLPAGGVADCPRPPILCPDGSVMPPNGKCDIEGEETVVPPLPDIAGEEGFAPRPKPNAEVLGAEAVAPAVLPATGVGSGMGLMTGAGFLLLAAGAGLAMRRRLT